MSFFKSYFWYNKSQRNGIVFLILFIFVFQFVYVFVDFSNDENFLNTKEMVVYQHYIDSIKSVSGSKLIVSSEYPKIYPFNPNYLTDHKAYLIGMSVSEIDRLLEFRKSGKFINSEEEFQRVTHVNDSLLNKISPFFKFPDWVKNSKNGLENKKEKSTRKIYISLEKDLNAASVKDFQSISGIGEKLAKRIISYREKLKGFSYNDQLYEVYYLRKEIANRVLSQFSVIQMPNIEKLNINDATFKEVLHLPYIDYELTKKIFNYRNEIHRFSTVDELKKIDSFPLDKFTRIALYLSAD